MVASYPVDDRTTTLRMVRVFRAPRERLVVTWAWHERSDFPAPREHETVLTLVFRSVGDRTEMTLTHGPFRDRTGVDNHNRGWTGSFDRLEALLATEGGSA